MIILCLFSMAQLASAQCYTKMMDASGIELDASDLKMLEDSACALKAIIPEKVRDSFAIIDFGFYAINENMVGGYPEFMDLMIDELAADAKSKYYILFARESSSNGGPNSKIWVKVKLPTWGQFSCMTEMQRSLFEIRLDMVVQKIPMNGYTAYVKAERDGISKARSMVAKILDCCYKREGCLIKECGTEDETKYRLQSLNFKNIGTFEKLADSDVEIEIPEIVGTTKSRYKIAAQEIDLDEQMILLYRKFRQDYPSKRIKIFLNQTAKDCYEFNEMLDNFRKDKTEVKIMVVATEPIPENITPYVLIEGMKDETIFDRLSKIGLDDHYFDLSGTYIGKSTNSWGQIRIMNKKDGENGFSLASIYKDLKTQTIKLKEGNSNSVEMSKHITDLKAKNQLQELYDMFGKIINYYEKEAKYQSISNILKVENVVISRLAVTKKAEKQIYLNVGISDLTDFDYYNQVINIIFHEKVHYSIIDDSDISFSGHADLVFRRQVAEDLHFQNTTPTYKFTILSTYACFIMGAEKVAREDATQIQNLKEIFLIQTKKINYGFSWEAFVFDYDITATNWVTGNKTSFNCKRIIEEEKLKQKPKP